MPSSSDSENSNSSGPKCRSDIGDSITDTVMVKVDGEDPSLLFTVNEAVVAGVTPVYVTNTGPSNA